MTGEVSVDSLTDSLTGLPNVSYLFEMLDLELKKAQRNDKRLTLLGMDLNGLKRINDQYGMAMGDEILVKVSNIFKEVFREYDTCVRYAGDEFYVVLPGVGKEEAPRTIERIRNAIDRMELEDWQDEEFRIGIHLGGAFFPEDGLDMEALISVAHSRLYQEKNIRQPVPVVVEPLPD
jgi:diguanylate cyclase (GGDEF)-like protein